MSDTNKRQVFEILECLYKNEKFFENRQKDEEYQGYLIEKRPIDKIKKDNNYDKIRPLIENNETFDKIKVYIPENKEQIKEIIPKKYNSSNNLKKELSSDRSFIIIKQDYIGKLCNNSKSNGKEIKFKFENNSIIIFNENDKLNTGNNNGIIKKEKSIKVQIHKKQIQAMLLKKIWRY